MKSELESFRSGMKAVFADVDALLMSLNDEQAALRPEAGAWSVSECLDHLTMTARAYIPVIEEHLRAGAPRGGASYKPGWLWRKFVESMEPPVRRKYPTSAAFVPAGARPLAEVQRDFIEAHEAILSRLDDLEGLDLGRIKIESPFAKWVRYPLGLVFYILPAHCRRHVWQARQVSAIVAP